LSEARRRRDTGLTLIASISLPNGDIPKRVIAVQVRADGFSIILKRNCSISPSGLALVFGALGALSLAIASGFALLGAWLILPFAGLEALVLGAAFLWVARHATDHERIELVNGRLVIEVADGRQHERFEFEARRARLKVETRIGGGVRVLLCERETELEVGRYLDTGLRSDLAAQLGRRLGIGQ
jgi:uncharacterized membrane protein